MICEIVEEDGMQSVKISLSISESTDIVSGSPVAIQDLVSALSVTIRDRSQEPPSE